MPGPLRTRTAIAASASAIGASSSSINSNISSPIAARTASTWLCDTQRTPAQSPTSSSCRSSSIIPTHAPASTSNSIRRPIQAISRRTNNFNNYATMSTMPAQHGHSEACCNIPPIVAKGYDTKGSYEELGGYKTYVTGPSDTTKGIITIYDIFGYYPQTLQGADILATSGSSKYKVFIPDWFKGDPCPIEWFPPNSEEKQENLGAFFQKNPPPGVAQALPGYVKAVSEKYPEIKDWAVLGFCWGGKVVSLVTSSPENPFKAGIEAHPAMVDPADASKIKIPLALLASKDEDAEAVKKFEANLSGPKYVETFPDQIHGWMAARSDLADEHVKSEYKRGYQTVLKFLSEHL
ncbi:alpha/beta-hydrolase [Xylariaceae sp. FL0594]|nr:alpha/beta-hydrolase [Xylariaceae sp. FL0594]